MPGTRWLMSALAVGVVLMTQEASAGGPTEQLRAAIEQVIATLEQPASGGEDGAGGRRRAVRKIAEGIFDLDETAQRSLGRHWRDRTETERREFVELFGDLLDRAYLSKLELYAGERVLYAGEVVDGDIALVRTRVILPKSGEEVPADYRMRRRGERWLVYDVVIEGVSLVANYRSQFNRVIAQGSYEELVKRMRAKQHETPQASATADRSRR